MNKSKLYMLAAVFCFSGIMAFAQNFTNPIVSGDVVFDEKDGILAVEAEYFYKQTNGEIRQWYRTSKNEQAKVGRDEDPSHCKDAGNNAYLEILPDTRVTHGDKLIKGENFCGEAGKMGVLHYKVKINIPGRYYVWVRAFSTGSEDNGLHVGINGEWPATGQRLQWCEGKQSWRWESKQRTDAVHCGEPYLIYLDIVKAGEHEITFSMREDGFEFDRFLLTNSKDYVPEGMGPKVRLASGKLPKTYPVVSENPKATPSYLYAVEKSTKGLKLFRAANFPIDGTNYYIDRNGKWLAVHPEKHKSATATMAFNANGGNFDLLVLGVGENDGNSKYEIAINGKKIGSYTVAPSTHSFEEGTDFIGVFKNVEINKGDKISVTAHVASNDGGEYSRARWGGIALVPAGEASIVLKNLAGVGTQLNVGQ